MMHASLVAHCDGTLYTVERDPSIPLGDSWTELMTPTPSWRVFATNRRGQKEVVLDTLLAGPVLLAADPSGLVVGEDGRAHLRGRDGAWRVVSDVQFMGGPTALANAVVTPESVVFACTTTGTTTLRVLDRATGAIEPAPDLPPHTRAIGLVGDSIAWTTGRPSVALRDLYEDEEPSLVALPSDASYLTSQGDLLIAVLARGLAIIRGDDAELHHLEHRFVQAWATNGGAWYALLGGYAELGARITAHVGACFCRLRQGVVEPIWAETPPPVRQHFEIGGLKSVAFADDRIYLVHAGDVITIDPEGPITQAVSVTA
jgi:hypothetical protein